MHLQHVLEYIHTILNYYEPQLPLRLQSGGDQPSPFPIFSCPTVVSDLDVHMVEDVKSVLLVELGLRKKGQVLRFVNT